MSNSSYKSILNIYTQKSHLSQIYISTPVENCSKFAGTVTINGKTFVASDPCSKKKHAEEMAAKAACIELGLAPKANKKPQEQGQRPLYAKQHPQEQIQRPFFAKQHLQEQIQRPFYAKQQPQEQIQRPFFATQQPQEQIQRPLLATQQPQEQIQRPLFATQQGLPEQFPKPSFATQQPQELFERSLFSTLHSQEQIQRPLLAMQQGPQEEIQRPLFATLQSQEQFPKPLFATQQHQETISRAKKKKNKRKNKMKSRREEAHKQLTENGFGSVYTGQTNGYCCDVNTSISEGFIPPDIKQVITNFSDMKRAISAEHIRPIEQGGSLWRAESSRLDEGFEQGDRFNQGVSLQPIERLKQLKSLNPTDILRQAKDQTLIERRNQAEALPQTRAFKPEETSKSTESLEKPENSRSTEGSSLIQSLKQLANLKSIDNTVQQESPTTQQNSKKGIKPTEGSSLLQSLKEFANPTPIDKTVQPELGIPPGNAKSKTLKQAKREVPDKPYKMILNQKAMKRGIKLPIYDTKVVAEKGIHGFNSEVTLLGITYQSPKLARNKKAAEHFAAKVCLEALESPVSGVTQSPIHSKNNNSSKGTDIRNQNQVNIGDSPIPAGSHALKKQFAPVTSPTPMQGTRQAQKGAMQNSLKQSFGVISSSFNSSKFMPHTPSTFNRVDIFNMQDSGSSSGDSLKRSFGVLSSSFEGETPPAKFFKGFKTPSPKFPNASFENTPERLPKKFGSPSPKLAKNSFEMQAPAHPTVVKTPSPKLPQKSPNSGNQSAGTPNQKPRYDYKSLLQEHLAQRGLKVPTYDHVGTPNGQFIGICQLHNKEFRSETPKRRKKEAQQDAAKLGLLHVGISDPEKVLEIRSVKSESRDENRTIMKANRKMTNVNSLPPSVRSRWLHTRQDDKEVTDDSFTEDSIFNSPSFVSFDAPTNREGTIEDLPTDDLYDALYKTDRNREDDPLKCWNDVEPTFNGTKISQTEDLSVCEDWPDRSSILVVGNSEFSIPMKCTAGKKIYSLLKKRNVPLKPGANIQGLVCKYSLVGNSVYLKAKCCKNVFYPEQPLPVLLSCGVVFVHYDPKASEPLQVLLERYLNSSAFFHATIVLLQWFRKFTNNNRCTLDLKAITQHICEWMDDEVKLLVHITKQSLKTVFSRVWKISNRCLECLPTQLPDELLQLQECCREELQRRITSADADEESLKKPWKLPKGNFKHRLLTTGIFTESAPECACRELKEETGVKVDLHEIQKCSYVDIPHLEKENYNPHKGDFVRYFLYLHRAEPVVEAHKNERCPTKMKMEDESDPSDDMIKDKRKDNEKPVKEEENRGTKRKREDDTQEDGERERKRLMPENLENSTAPETETISQGEPTNEDESLDTSVRTTTSEECTWRSLRVAVKESDVFKRIYDTEQFKQFIHQINGVEKLLEF